MKLFTTIAAFSLVAAPVQASVNSKHHELCKEAKDYAGCIRAMTSDVTEQSAIKIDQTSRPGLLSEMGNQCPAGYAYSGAGRCRQVLCMPMGIFGKNEPQLAGKGHHCRGRNLDYGILGGRASLRWGNNYINASNNPSCPQNEPRIGHLSSCSVSRMKELLGSEQPSSTSDLDDWDSSPSDYVAD